MSDIRREKIPASQLKIGMFVSELDRPWLGTPFLLEGLLIESDEQLQTLSSLCEFVYIDRTFSVGQHFVAPPKEDRAIKRDGPVIRINANNAYNKKNISPTSSNSNGNSTANQFSFFDVLRELKSGQQSVIDPVKKNNPNPVQDNIILTVQHNNSNEINNAQPTKEQPSLSTQIKADLKNFISGFTGWKNGQKKLGTSIDPSKSVTNAAVDNTNRVVIFEETNLVEVEIATIYPVYEKSQIATRELFESLALDQQIDLTNVNEALTSMVDCIERNPDALIWLAKLKQTDNHAYNHAMNVSIMLMALATFMSMPKKQVKDLGLAGLLQDIGKAKIPYDLLHKTEKITKEEFELLKKHVDHALEVLEVTENISGTVILTVSQHHERFDGSGYPYQLPGKQISLSGQMAGLIDTYCALTSNKVYARGVYNQMALEKIHKLRDIKFSGVLIDQLVQFLGMYPVSSLVELNTGEVGVVIQQNSVRRLLPRVMILLNPDKTKNEYPATINLINMPQTPTGEPYSIVRGLPSDSYGLNASSYYG